MMFAFRDVFWILQVILCKCKQTKLTSYFWTTTHQFRNDLDLLLFIQKNCKNIDWKQHLSPMRKGTTTPSRHIGQASSSVADATGSWNFVTSDFLGEKRNELAWVLQSNSSRSSHVAKVSKLLRLMISLTDLESGDCGHPKTTSYGRGTGGGRKVSGVDVFKFNSTRRPAVNAEAATLWDVKETCSSKAGGHCTRML